MNAVISGRAGLALVTEGKSLMSLDVDDLESFVPRTHYLDFRLSGATDLVALENTGRDEIAERLELEHDIACALDMTLISLDLDASMELRAEAISALDELLADAHVVGALECTLYAKPLPPAADLAGAYATAHANSAETRSMFERLRHYQPAIIAVRQSWDAIPDNVFGDEETARAAFHNAVHREGLFRALALRYGDRTRVSLLLFDSASLESIHPLPNHYEVLGRWFERIQQIPLLKATKPVPARRTRNERLSEATRGTQGLGPRAEDDAHLIKPFSRSGATISPRLLVVRSPDFSADSSVERSALRKTVSMPKSLRQLTVAEYLEAEQDSLVRHEYVDGQIFAMAGASDRHNRISINLTSKLDDKLGDGPCEVFMADMKVWVSESVFYYPDVVVACDAPGVDAYYRKQPRLIIEVSSQGTERVDRSEKLVAYKQVKSLKEYVIIAQNRVRVEIFRRGRGDRWNWEVLTELSDELRLESVGLTLTLAEVYRRVFPRRARRR